MPRLPAPDPSRSRNADDYQHLPQSVAAMAKEFEHHQSTGPHSHPRAQLIYAVAGAMRVTTPDGLWTLPPLRALWVPAGVVHGIEMLDAVSMRTLYVQVDAARALWDRCQVIEVPPLLRELILALTAEPVAYAPQGRAAQIAALLLTELRSAPVVPIQVPWPQDRRLQAICRAILAQPGLDRRLEDWGDEVGASGRTLIRLFQAELGLNYRQWVQQVRLADALHRLAMGQPVARVAAELGYSSPSAFTAMFRRALGSSPQQLRRENMA
ncbi:AraC family transcriptional regulator [Bordetella genomosp. 13]|uniref:AraC family transcriptional regulator n=1 Tax=Bordetella genomosp. 13 TaxID=463040 RepID=UPI0011A138B8|nr:helix-turn-helix transcriptional regulator [Bordetella genomosp. 13]